MKENKEEEHGERDNQRVKRVGDWRDQGENRRLKYEKKVYGKL